ncbi:putative mannosyl-oligosaccharide glucosidase [Diaporthe ampelina]|uniref:Mannosyl-oligosaccharide glucosidase n=1 Tax=Diaporthe ampelina TaxID=1214573 RepID=A0A0G2FRD9_9PEZI|nr:putative mannosyl-oligosaccharide glucosidase [Diaporthe ampelina]
MGFILIHLLAIGTLLNAWLVSSAQIGDNNNKLDWQTWGPYRPNLYFGVRPQIPETLLMGLIWASGDDRNRLVDTLRDTCEQEDGVKGYGWTTYDPRVGGSQIIHDQQLQIDLTTEFVKSEDGHGWSVRVTGTPRPGAPATTKTTLIFHVALEGMAGSTSKSKSLYCEHLNKGTGHSLAFGASCHGQDPKLGPFDLVISTDSRDNIIHRTAVKSSDVPEDKIWQAKSVFSDLLKNDDSQDSRKVVPSSNTGAGNIHFVHYNFIGAFSATFNYRNAPNVTRLDELRTSFPSRVDKVFPRSSVFHEDKYAVFAQGLLSNLLGGLGFFHGDSRVAAKEPEFEETEPDFWMKEKAAMSRASVTTTEPTSLLSFTPSRSVFPRGFLWDEGFHLLPVIEWDLDLAVSVIRSWFKQMDGEGWIAREQILGPEVRNKVPPQFQTQYPHHANPPTMLALVLPALLKKVTRPSSYFGHPSKYLANEEAGKALIKELYPLFDRHFSWFRRTQAGDLNAWPRPDDHVLVESYRWRGRTPKHTLTSGLDDYPRANPPHPGELHVDALAWVGASSRALMQAAQALGDKNAADVHREQMEAVQHNMDVLHWDENTNAYCDATIVGHDASAQFQHVCHQGYVSLFPLLMGLMKADHPHLPAVLDLLSDPHKLWSRQGLRSLSSEDHGYRKDEDYWRGAVWMNINVLAVQRLRAVGLEGHQRPPTAIQERALTLAAELRDRVVKTVYRNYQQTGFAWEQYDDKTGKGRHSRAFTGWTACVIMLMGLEFTRGQAMEDVIEQVFEDLSRDMGVSTSTPFILLAAVLFVVLFRRKLMGVIASVVEYWQARSAGRGARGRYDAVELNDRKP